MSQVQPKVLGLELKPVAVAAEHQGAELVAGKHGLTQLANLAQLPPTGAVVVVAPLKLVDGTGTPTRVLALV